MSSEDTIRSEKLNVPVEKKDVKILEGHVSVMENDNWESLEIESAELESTEDVPLTFSSVLAFLHHEAEGEGHHEEDAHQTNESFPDSLHEVKEGEREKQSSISAFLAVFTDAELIKCIDEMEEEIKRLNMENQLYTEYLSILDSDTEDWLARADAVTSMQSSKSSGKSTSDTAEQTSSMEASSTSSSISATSNGPRINLSIKSQVLTKAIEVKIESLEDFCKKSYAEHQKLRCQMEELRMREQDIREDVRDFELHVLEEGLNKMTRRIAAEKWLKFMRDWSKSANRIQEKLRLRILYTTAHYRKACADHERRKDLGENIQLVDYQRLKFEEKHLIRKLEQKNTHLKELKKLNGAADAVILRYTKYLEKLSTECESMKRKIQKANEESRMIERQANVVIAETEQAQKKYIKARDTKGLVRAPHMMEYVRRKEELYQIQRQIKIWERKFNVQYISLTSGCREMMYKVGRKAIDEKWFLDTDDIISSEPSFSFTQIEAYREKQRIFEEEARRSFVFPKL